MSHNVQSQSKKGNKKVERLKEGGETSIAVEGTTTAWWGGVAPNHGSAREGE